MPLKKLLSQEEIQNRIHSLSEDLSRRYRESNPILLGIMKGSLYFLSDLSRSLDFPHEIDFLRVNTYREGMEGNPGAGIEYFGSLDVKDREVLLVDEILDQGHTVKVIEPFIRNLEPKSHAWVFLLAKEGARERAGVNPEYVGFEIGKEWVVGYGMDLDEAYRGLPDIYQIESVGTEGSAGV